MELILDTANLKDIEKLSDYLCIDGITTNPSIISKEKRDFKTILIEIDKIIGKSKPIHAQVVSTKFEDILEEALYINDIRENIYVKIPVSIDGLKAIKELKKYNIKITATAIFTAHQGIIAAKAGADYVAPYVNRLDNISADGISTVGDLIKILNIYDMKTKVLGASFKDAYKVLELLKLGVHSVTIPVDICYKMLEHPLTDLSVYKFIEDWYSVFGYTKIIKKNDKLRG